MTERLVSDDISNPTDLQRHAMLLNGLIAAGREIDYDNIVALLSPPTDITHFGRPGAKKNIKVGIIGGGLAGMAAAFELRKLGFDITIFEPRQDHIGGRVYTYYFKNDPSLYGEFGPMRIPASHETTWHYINLFRINTVPFEQYNPNAINYVRGVRARNTPESIMQDIYPKFSLTSTEKNTPWPEIYSRIPHTILNNMPPEVRKEMLQVLPRSSPQYEYYTYVSVRKVLESFGLSQGAIELITNLQPMTNAVLYDSFGEEIDEEYDLSFLNLYRIVGGTAKLPLAFFNSLTSQFPKEYPDIPYDRLGKVTWKGGTWIIGIAQPDMGEKVILSYTNTPKRIGQNETFDFVICALPLSELRQIQLDPLFRGRKMQAIQEINYIDAQKTLFFCKERFWEKGNPARTITGGIFVTDMLIQSIIYPNKPDNHARYRNNEPGILTASYNLSLDAERLSTIGKQEQLVITKRQVEQVHGLPNGYLDSILIDSKSVDWLEELRFSGAFSRFYPGQRTAFFYELSIPEYNSRVFFAGEHVSPKHAWMQGALQSGMLAANNISYYCQRISS